MTTTLLSAFVLMFASSDHGGVPELPGNTCFDAVNASLGANPFDTSDATDSGHGQPDESQCENTYLDWQCRSEFEKIVQIGGWDDDGATYRYHWNEAGAGAAGQLCGCLR